MFIEKTYASTVKNNKSNGNKQYVDRTVQSVHTYISIASLYPSNTNT